MMGLKPDNFASWITNQDRDQMDALLRFKMGRLTVLSDVGTAANEQERLSDIFSATAGCPGWREASPTTLPSRLMVQSKGRRGQAKRHRSSLIN